MEAEFQILYLLWISLLQCKIFTVFLTGRNTYVVCIDYHIIERTTNSWS